MCCIAWTSLDFPSDDTLHLVRLPVCMWWECQSVGPVGLGMATPHAANSRLTLNRRQVAADTPTGSAEGKVTAAAAAHSGAKRGGQVIPSGKAMDGTATAEPRGRYNRSTHLGLSISGLNLAHLCDGDAI